jgi:hypothetical protein
MRMRPGKTPRTLRLVIGVSAVALLATGCSVIRVSVSSTGIQGNDESAGVVDVTDDGRYSLFVSYATNLVANDTNAAPDVFRHDTKTGATVRANVAPNGGQLDGTLSGAMSPDGRYVAFTTTAALDPADTNGTRDAYVRDLTALTTTWASQPPAGGFATGGVAQVAVSTGGRFVSFLWETPSDGAFPFRTLYRRDRQVATTTQLSTTRNILAFIASRDARHYVLDIASAHGSFLPPVLVDTDGSANGWPALAPFCGFDSVDAISADGRYIALNSRAPQGECLPVGIYIIDRTTAIATPVGNLLVTGISRDGKMVLGHGDGSLSPGGTPGRVDLYLHDVPNNRTVRFVNSTSGGDQNADITDSVLSDDAHAVGFVTSASDLVGGDTNGVGDVFAWPGPVNPGTP